MATNHSTNHSTRHLFGMSTVDGSGRCLRPLIGPLDGSAEREMRAATPLRARRSRIPLTGWTFDGSHPGRTLDVQ